MHCQKNLNFVSGRAMDLFKDAIFLAIHYDFYNGGTLTYGEISNLCKRNCKFYANSPIY